MQERRSQVRYDVSMSGELIWANGSQRKACRVVDLSLDGARVDVGFYMAVPPNVYFLEAGDGRLFECQVKWQQGAEIGLHFIDVGSRAARRALIDRYAVR